MPADILTKSYFRKRDIPFQRRGATVCAKVAGQILVFSYKNMLNLYSLMGHLEIQHILEENQL